MSYYSTVRMVTTKYGYDLMVKTIDSYLQQHCCDPSMNLLDPIHLDYYQIEKDGIYFGWDNIRWYDQLFPYITAIMEAIELLDTKNLEFQFLRVGESYADIQEIYRLTSGRLHPFYPLVTIIGGPLSSQNNA